MAVVIDGLEGISKVQESAPGVVVNIAKVIDTTNFTTTNTAAVANGDLVAYTPLRADSRVMVIAMLDVIATRIDTSDNDTRATFKVGSPNSGGTIVYWGNANEDANVGMTNQSTVAGSYYGTPPFTGVNVDRNAAGNIIVKVHITANLDPAQSATLYSVEATFVEYMPW